jgi:hypothetical protein
MVLNLNMKFSDKKALVSKLKALAKKKPKWFG